MIMLPLSLSGNVLLGSCNYDMMSSYFFILHFLVLVHRAVAVCFFFSYRGEKATHITVWWLIARPPPHPHTHTQSLMSFDQESMKLVN